jgi:RNA polymerase sigma-70 factor (ECF subfamily)
MAARARTAARWSTTDDTLKRAYDAHGGELYRFALRASGDRGAAEDVVQETFLRAWRASDRYDPALASMRTWLFAIARNVIIDQARARGSRPFAAVVSAAESPEAVDQLAGDVFDQVLSRWLVEEALRHIGDEHRHVIVETYLRGRPQAEVAAELGVPPGTVRSRLFYGLKAVRSAMNDLGVTA